jgi:hypothetical protein
MAGCFFLEDRSRSSDTARLAPALLSWRLRRWLPPSRLRLRLKWLPGVLRHKLPPALLWLRYRLPPTLLRLWRLLWRHWWHCRRGLAPSRLSRLSRLLAPLLEGLRLTPSLLSLPRCRLQWLGGLWWLRLRLAPAL